MKTFYRSNPAFRFNVEKFAKDSKVIRKATFLICIQIREKDLKNQTML